jgi:ribosomal protein S15P/S13E
MDKKLITSRMRLHEKDTGSEMFQIGSYVCRIRQLHNHIVPKRYLESDLEGMGDSAQMTIVSDVSNKGNFKDHPAKRCIQKLVARIKRLLRYVKANKPKEYIQIIEYAKTFGDGFEFITRYKDGTGEADFKAIMNSGESVKIRKSVKRQF